MANSCVLCPKVDAESPTLAKPNEEVVEMGVKAKATIVDASRSS